MQLDFEAYEQALMHDEVMALVMATAVHNEIADSSRFPDNYINVRYSRVEDSLGFRCVEQGNRPNPTDDFEGQVRYRTAWGLSALMGR